MVIEHRSGENIRVGAFRNSEHIQARRLQTPALYVQRIGEGVTLTFNNHSSQNQNIFNTGASINNAMTATIANADGTPAFFNYDSRQVQTRSIFSVSRVEVPARGSIQLIGTEQMRGQFLNVYGSHTVFSGQPYRLTIDGQRSFPPGLEQDLPPVETTPPVAPVRIPPEYQELFDMLNTLHPRHANQNVRGFELLFGDYNAFTSIWLDNVGGWEVAALGLSSDTRRAMGIGAIISLTFGISFTDEATAAMMNNPRNVETLIQDVVSDLVGTTHHRSVNENVHGLVGILSSLSGVAGSMGNQEAQNFGRLLDAALMVDSLDAGLSRQLQDYERNIEMLMSIRSLHASPLWRNTIDGAIARYQLEFVSSLVNAVWDLSVSEIMSLTLGAPSVAITSVIDYVLSHNASVTGLEAMIISDNINLATIEAFRNAAERIADGNFTSADVERYMNSFYIARGLQIRRYEAMSGSFRIGSPERNYINAQLGRLRQMTHDRFVFSVPFVASENTTVAGEIGAWVIPGNQPSAWAADHVNAAILAGLAPIELQSNFTTPTTRAEFAALAVSLYETVTETQIAGRMQFNDTNDINVQKMGYLGVVGGVGNGNFNPNGTITRQEAAVMLARLIAVIDQPLPIVAPTFADNAQLASWATQAVGQIQAAGIMGGVGNNQFNSTGNFTREQSIITMLRLFEELN